MISSQSGTSRSKTQQQNDMAAVVASPSVAAMQATSMQRFKPGETQVMALRDALFSDTGRDKDVRVCVASRRVCHRRPPPAAREHTPTG
jgi:hypothetical protein